MLRHGQLVIACVVAAAMVAAVAAWPQTLVVRAGRAETVSDGPIEHGVIVITDGRITAIGKDVPVPEGAAVIDASSGVVCPGFVHPFSRLGLSDAPTDKPVNNAHYRIADELYPFQDIYKYAASAGYTTLCLVSYQQGLGGQTALVRTVADDAEAMLLTDRGPLSVGFWTSSTELRDTLTGAFDRAKNNQGGERGAAVAWAYKGQVPTLVRCSGPGAVVNLLDVLQPYKDLKLAVLSSNEGTEQVAPQLAQAKIPIILPAAITFQRFTRIRVSLPRLMSEAGVKVACIPSTANPAGLDGFRAAMAEQIRAGLPRDVALRAMTLTPAEILGLDYRLGSLQMGKDANLVILSGDPFDAATTVQRVLIEGQTVYDAAWGGIR